MDVLDYRHEWKFLCKERDLYLMECKVQHICRRDTYAGDMGDYWIKSLYFDTYGDRYYYENLAGVDDRKKYRIRIYDNKADGMKLECKYSIRDRKRKESCGIDRQQYDALTGKELAWSGNCDGLLERFQVERRTELLVPKVVVEYRRSPYVCTAGNVRITFDRNIRTSSQVDKFFEENLIYRNVLAEDTGILEVKFDGFLPVAVREVLAVGRDLRRTSFSKYALCREYGIR